MLVDLRHLPVNLGHLLPLVPSVGTLRPVPVPLSVEHWVVVRAAGSAASHVADVSRPQAPLGCRPVVASAVLPSMAVLQRRPVRLQVAKVLAPAKRLGRLDRH